MKRSKPAGVGAGTASGLERATIEPAHLGRYLEELALLTPKQIEDRLHELAAALDVVQRGHVAVGSRVALGLRAGESFELAPGVRVHLADVDPHAAGALREVDVLVLTKEGGVEMMEVKRSTEALWHALEQSRGEYVKKFLQWRAEGPVDSPPRSVAFVFGTPGRARLDDPVAGLKKTAAELLSQAGFELRWLGVDGAAL